MLDVRKGEIDVKKSAQLLKVCGLAAVVIASTNVQVVKAETLYDIHSKCEAFTVTFMNGETILDVQIVNKGESAIAPKAPVYQGTSNYRMVFAGWDADYKNVQGNLVINALYKKEAKNTWVGLYMETPQEVQEEQGYGHMTVSYSDSLQFRNIFNASLGTVRENEDGVVVMEDGALVRLEDQMINLGNFKFAASPYEGRCIIEDEGTTYAVYTAKDGDVYRTDLNTVDWDTYYMSGQIFGMANWEETTKYSWVGLYIEKPEEVKNEQGDAHMKLTHSRSVLMKDVFVPALNIVEENAEGVIVLANGTKITLEDKMQDLDGFKFTASPYQAGCSIEEAEDTTYAVYTALNGDVYKADLSKVDWHAYYVGRQVWGAVDWVKTSTAY